MAASELRAIPITGIGEVKGGDSLPELIGRAVVKQKLQFQAGDILVVTHKIVSKAEGFVVPLKNIEPSQESRQWGERYHTEPRAIELAQREARRIVRKRGGVLITETQHGFVCANSGVDLSNVDGGRSAVLLPQDPDASAEQLAHEIKRRSGVTVPVIITDTFGRAWREGLCEVAIGIFGMNAFRDYRRRRDPHGYCLRVSLEAVADELAAMAGLACGKLSRSPACIIRGFAYQPGKGSGRDLVRPAAKDLFR